MADLTFKANLNPADNGVNYDIGSNSMKWKAMYATTFNGNLSGNATTATTATNATNATNASKAYINSDTSSTLYVLGATSTGNQSIYRESSVYMSGDVLYGAAWNDFAEFRASKDNMSIEPGRVVKECGDDTLELTQERMQRGCSIVSDTFGFAIGKINDCQLPIAVAGRVLAHPYESLADFKEHIGYPVCSGPNGTVSIMSEEEERNYPSCIIGTISAVPDYEIWHGGRDVKVNNRVWIKVR